MYLSNRSLLSKIESFIFLRITVPRQQYTTDRDTTRSLGLLFLSSFPIYKKAQLKQGWRAMLPVDFLLMVNSQGCRGDGISIPIPIPYPQESAWESPWESPYPRNPK